MKDVVVHVENFRSLQGTYDIRIAPLTLLVGENSSGKTALMAAVSAALNGLIPVPQRLEAEPFLLGTPMSQISEGATSMLIGSTRSGNDGRISARATFSGSKDFWHPKSLSISVEEAVSLKVERSANSKSYSGYTQLHTSKGIDETVVKSDPQYGGSLVQSAIGNFNHLIRQHLKSNSLDKTPIASYWLNRLYREAMSERAHAISPIRSRPQRVYEDKTPSICAEGEHVPSFLDFVLKSKTRGAKLIKEQLFMFSKQAGLFESARSKGFDNPAGHYFSIILENKGIARTIQDMGYGVSQVLPIVADLIGTTSSEYYLIQQPEVHLHPKGQAALASFFVHMINTFGMAIVVETHSDYIVDRVRVEVANERIAESDVLIYFLECQNGQTKLTPISLDSKGNFIGAPDTFRSFFLEEQLSLMGWE